jgi:phosphohistidine phosphatase
MAGETTRRRRAASVVLVLVRHGEAGTAASDEARELTQTGRRGVRMLSAELQSKAFSPAAIRTSPYRRARQTAETIFSALPDPGPIQDTNLLAPGATPETLLQLLKAEKPGSAALWVGHMPDLGRFAARLLGEVGEVAFKPGTAVGLRVNVSVTPPKATVEWTWNPA